MASPGTKTLLTAFLPESNIRSLEGHYQVNRCTTLTLCLPWPYQVPNAIRPSQHQPASSAKRWDDSTFGGGSEVAEWAKYIWLRMRGSNGR
jgi:hypothetical protein